ncbi:MAG TPA: NADH-ubiquinone oxidoreductase-F iron-sulfur binding region domain-containing protein [Clostridiales bacterium]|nr:NADH-ubiquinone oxidoreductase-F iron-sulfur binding region domain-containing protein [Clostridiales bacterium]
MIITVGMGSCGIAAGAQKTFDAIAALIEKENLDVTLKPVGCIGACFNEPVVEIIDHDNGNEKHYLYAKIDGEKAAALLKSHLEQGIPLEEFLVPQTDMAFLEKQTRIALSDCGVINPEDITEYIEHDGFQALKHCLHDLTPEEVIEEIKISGLRGRGGAGFPTWFKWNAARQNQDDIKYMICNADEGDPGAFMDRSLLESNPHSVLEGMMIGAYAIGAREGKIYVRAEYPLAIKRLEKAIEEEEKKGYLGDHILGTDFSFRLEIKAGAGAFVCGEETALIASLEGERGMPRLKPPFPAERGYLQKPSNINNVETYANVPWILRHGGNAFAAMGTEKSKGTKVFALAGKVKKGGLVEVPMGMTIHEIIFGIGGGIKDDREIKGVQMGGPSGGCIPKNLLDTAVDYESITKVGAIMGSGGMIVMDETTCMVDMARFFLQFTKDESCGKCVHCRIGTKRMLEILERIVNGEGKDGDIETLKTLGENIIAGSLCGLGQSAPNPVLSTLRHFEEEYRAHIEDHKCPAKKCKPLLTFSIDPEKCTACMACKKKCPVDAISGEKKKPQVIDANICIHCGNCEAVCKFGAVIVE